MSDDGYWFRPKRYGYGATPDTWQGWALTAAFVAIVYGIVFAFRQQPLVIIAILIPLALGFTIITIRMTRGGWRWRWGDKE